MPDQHNAVIRRAVERAPDFMKQELLSKDPVVRSRAEEALAVIIATALASERDTSA